MDIDDVKLDEELESLWRQLKRLHRALRDHTYKRYSRVNPFVENLFDWKEKGEFFGGKNVTIYDSTTIVGDVKIGDHTWIGPFCSLDGTAGLVIGRYCSISLGCQLLTHDTVKWALSGGKMSYEYANTKIGDGSRNKGCWRFYHSWWSTRPPHWKSSFRFTGKGTFGL
jgi:acetyltransferase-like isoleucine patch superfamily enzyme